MEDLKQKPDTKDDVNPKFTPDGGPKLSDAINTPKTDVGVGSLGNQHKPFKVK